MGSAAKIITFGISKGGCSKSTTSGITAKLLSANKKFFALIWMVRVT